MVGILIVAHGTLGEALIHCASHVLGKWPLHIRHLGITVRDDPDAMGKQAQELLHTLDDGDGVLVLTDMLGATPSNVAARLQRSGSVEIVSGVNLPMLVRALTYREDSLAAVVAKAVSGGRDGVVHLGTAELHAAARS